MVVNACDEPVANGWAKDSTLFKEAVRRAGQASGYGKVKGIIWYSNYADGAELYGNMHEFILDLREALGTQDIPFITSYLPEWLENSGQVNGAIGMTSRITRYTSAVSAEWLVWRDNEKNGDLDRISNIKLGERFAERMIETQRFIVTTP